MAVPGTGLTPVHEVYLPARIVAEGHPGAGGPGSRAVSP